MIVVGLCGGSGSGKGEVSAVFRKKGYPTIDTDAVYHGLTSSASECLDELVSTFGGGILKDGALNRRALADIVFSTGGSGESLAVLNAIAHKHVLARTRSLLSDYSDKGVLLAVVDAPLLFESGFDRECDVTVAVLADRDIRIKRIMTRDNITCAEAARRIDAQHTDEWLTEHADVTITNNGSTEELTSAVSQTIEDIIERLGGV